MSFQEFHDDLSNRNKDVERLTKTVNTALKKQLHGSAWKLSESDVPSPRVTTLQNKWRTVWRMSVDRKKKLQDSLDQLLEVSTSQTYGTKEISNVYYEYEYLYSAVEYFLKI